MSSGKFGLGKFSAIAIAVAIVGGSFIYSKGWHQFIFEKKLTPIAAAKLIPDEAIMSSFISTDVNNWTKLEELGLPKLEELFSEPIGEIEEELSGVGISYQQDIQPWIGDAMIAIIPTTDSANDIEDANPLVIIGVEDPLKANNFLKKIQSHLDENIEKTKYKGVEITTHRNSNGSTTYNSLLGNKLVVSNKIDTVKKSIDTYKGKPSLGSTAKTKELFQQKLKIDNSLAQVYFPHYDRLIASSLQNSGLSEDAIENLQVLESLSFGVGTEGDTIKFQSIAKLDSQLIKQQYTNSSGKILATLPEDTIIFFSGQGISTFWTELSELANQEPDFKTALDGARTSTKFVTGLDLDRDIFGWMDGEFALGIVPNTQPNIPQLNIGLGGAIVLETSDRKTAQNTMDKLENKIQQNLGLVSQKNNVKKTDITQWPISNTNLVFSSGWLDKNNLLFTLGSEEITSLYDSSKSSLKTNPKFQAVEKELPKKNVGYFYLDMETIMTEIGPLLLQQDPEVDKLISVLNSITAIGGTTTIVDKETSQTDMVILFKD